MTQKTTLTALLGAGLLTAGLSQAALVHHYTFDEGSGTTITDSAGSTNGTWAAGGGAGLAWTTGKIGGAADFQNGGGAVNHFGLSGGLAITNQASISVWVQNDQASGYRGILTTRDDGTPGSFSLATENGHIDFHTLNGATNQLDSLDGVPTDGTTWTHVLATWDQTTQERYIYINGQPAGTGLSTMNTNVGGSPLIGGASVDWRIGNDNCCGDRDLDGRLDDLAIWDNILTAADAATIFAAGNNGISAPDALAVPEPSTSLLGALAALALLRRRR